MEEHLIPSACLKDYTRDGQEPRGVKRKYNGVVYNTFIYPSHGVQVMIEKEAGMWANHKWYEDYMSFLEEWTRA